MNKKPNKVTLILDLNNREDMINAYNKIIDLIDKHDRRKIAENYKKLRREMRQDKELIEIRKQYQ